MAITIASANPNIGEDTYVIPADALRFWFLVSTLATDCHFRGTSTGAPNLNLVADVLYGPFSARDIIGESLYFNSAGNSTVDIMVETGLNS